MILAYLGLARRIKHPLQCKWSTMEIKHNAGAVQLWGSKIQYNTYKVQCRWSIIEVKHNAGAIQCGPSTMHGQYNEGAVEKRWRKCRCSRMQGKRAAGALEYRCSTLLVQYTVDAVQCRLSTMQVKYNAGAVKCMLCIMQYNAVLTPLIWLEVQGGWKPLVCPGVWICTNCNGYGLLKYNIQFF